MRVAVIDLGTNTCNLLIAETNNGNFEILHQSKQLVKLGDDKIKDSEISPEATQRTLKAFEIHKTLIKQHKVEKVKVIATSAVRMAENKIPFLDSISEDSGWIIKVISGEKEAELIFKGVLLAFKKLENPAVILDIGGGSNELIGAFEKSILWKESRPTGMSRIINQFKLSDPITAEQINTLKTHFSKEHKFAFEHCKQNHTQTLIGCSGAFDTIADIIDQVNPGEKSRQAQEFSLNGFYSVYQTLIKSTRMERLKMKGMDVVRVDLIVPAMILIEQLISGVGISTIIQTDFALREGVIYDQINRIKPD